jgi:S-adenosylmethionine hydrolase
MRRIVTLLTDFGTRDHYVAAMKGALLSINPALVLVDISHEITRHSIREGGFLLASAFDAFPAGTIHLAVVDPGVEDSQRPVPGTSSSALIMDSSIACSASSLPGSWCPWKTPSIACPR